MPDLTLLEKGACKNGHLISSDSDVVRIERPHGKSYNRCKTCRRDQQRMFNERRTAKRVAVTGLSGNKRRYVVFSCGHSPIFTPMLPAVGDTVYCTSCNDAATVTRWGKVVTAAEHDGQRYGELRHGNSTGMCRKGHYFDTENTRFRSLPDGTRARICRTCAAAWNKEYNEDRRRRRAE